MGKTSELVRDLLSRMTLEEKVAQLCAVHSNRLTENGKFSPTKARELLKNGIGQITRLVGDPEADPRQAVELGNEIQRFLREETRLGIPAMIHEECLSGLMMRGATVFPQAIALGSTFSPELVERMTTTIRKKMRALGVHQGLAPVLDIPRDPRWGRTEETFGEDPYLVSRMGAAYIRGLQGEDLRQGVVATAKHFTAYGISEGGRNLGPARVGERELREVFLFPFEVAVREAGVCSIMNAYHDIDGVPCAASYFLLTRILREEWGFEGIVVSDYNAVRMLENFHRVARDAKEAAIKALQAGIDIELPDIDCYQFIVDAVREGMLSEKVVDEAVRRVLNVKFELGLFEEEMVTVQSEKVVQVLDTEEERALAREIACASMVLLRNDGVLPLSKDVKSIAVIGPNAAEKINLHGDYSYSAHIPSVQAWKGKEAVWKEWVKTVSVLEGIKNKVSPQTEVLYARGCDLGDDSRDGFQEALNVAQQAEVIIAVMGERSGLFKQSISGEGSDRTELTLPGVQRELLRELKKLEKPIVLVLVNGRPLELGWEAENLSAILEAWYPGEEGGNAVADVLFGDYNPAGRLPISFPKKVGQIPVYYNRKSTAFSEYIETDARALFPFGYGLSYTRFEYQDLQIQPDRVTSLEGVKIRFRVKNTGRIAGDEVVQLYIRDVVSSLVRPSKELKGFKRIHLEAGEERTVTFTLYPEQLAFYDEHMRFVVEPGVFEVLVGASSEDIKLQGTFEVVREQVITKYRHFASKVEVL
ncbi:glycoside hydrolase family 3 N-terminal domain-containing protein [Thermatribacter velox]|uniref:Glycoside hydrolase family 3 N-terminal domain-containing protein n=1 Tax=Thermatribacter velox TaxID=3039681 RepID=A0ABZ2YDN8_9BACT